MSASNNAGPPTSTTLGTAVAERFLQGQLVVQQCRWDVARHCGHAGDSGVVTTVPASDGSGVYTLGQASDGTHGSGTGAVGVTGYTFQAAGSPVPFP